MTFLARRPAGLRVTATSGVTLSPDLQSGSFAWSGSSAFYGSWVRRAAGWSSKRYFELVPNGSIARGYIFGWMKHSEWLGTGNYPENPFGESFYGVCNGNTGGMSIGRFLNGTISASGTYDFATTDVMGLAMDYDTGNGWVLKNGVSLAGDPSAGTSPPFSVGTGGDWDPYWTVYSPSGTGSGSVSIHLSGWNCVYDPPTGFAHQDS